MGSPQASLGRFRLGLRKLAGNRPLLYRGRSVGDQKRHVLKREVAGLDAADGDDKGDPLGGQETGRRLKLPTARTDQRQSGGGLSRHDGRQ
jgi:hypothetical protein